MDGPYTLSDGRIVELEWEDSTGEMSAWTATGPRQKIGEFAFHRIEEGDNYRFSESFRVTHMDLRGPDGSGAYLRKGIGREIIRRVCTHAPVIFGPNDGIDRSDGSHLIEDGPDFATAMEREGLARQENSQIHPDQLRY